MINDELNKTDYFKFAALMVHNQIQARGINNPKLLSIMKKIPRHLFAVGFDFERSYGDFPLPIGFSQTISQPYIVAYMTDLLLLTGKETVLEIGTGSGYQTSVLSELASHVYTIENVNGLYERSKSLLGSLEYKNIDFMNGDGSCGWQEKAPFDRIIVTAALPEVPAILKNQLQDDGIFIAPVGNYQTYQVLIKIQRRGDHFIVNEDIKCRFVPIIGKYGF